MKKIFSLLGLSLTIASSAFASPSSNKLKCILLNYENVDAKGDFEQIPFTFTAGKTSVVEMNGNEHRILILEAEKLSAKHSVTGKPTFMVKGTLLLPSKNSSATQWCNGDEISKAAYYIANLDNGIQIFLEGQMDNTTNCDGTVANDASATVICTP
jgi:hypothetical protein